MMLEIMIDSRSTCIVWTKDTDDILLFEVELVYEDLGYFL